MLRIQLLGGFHLQSDDGTITTLTVPRLQSLLAYLILHCENPLQRQHLAFLFWPDSTEAQARTNLRHALHDIRLALPDAEAYLDIQTQWLQWRRDSDFTLDVSEFEAANLQAAELVPSQQIDTVVKVLARAVELYRGPFLSGSYEDWVLVKREELAQLFGQTLNRLLSVLERRQEYTAAIGYAQRLLRHDPLAETTYQHLMRLHVLQGDRAAALRVYHECVAMLERELGVEPSAETRTAYSQLFNENISATVPADEPVRTGDTPILIGREVEWQQLLFAWQRAGQGHAQVVAITGEAGIGKTRLAETLSNWVSRQALRAATARVFEAEGGHAYAPLIDLLRTESLAMGLSTLSDLWLEQVARLLPELRQHHPYLARVEATDALAQRQHFYEALARAVLSDGRSLLLVIDDLHWCDRETLEWLSYLLRFAQQARLLLVVTIRSGEVTAEHPLHPFLLSLRREHRLTEIALARLTPVNTALLAGHIAGRALASDEVADLYRQTEGNPLFVVEMVRAARARWVAGDDQTHKANGLPLSFVLDASGSFLPDTVQAVIQARLVQLTPLAREVAGHAAILGGSFSLELLAHAGGYSEDELVRALDELWQRHILREQGSLNYDFSHAQIRKVVYLQLSPMRRRLLHRRAAQALESVYGQRVDAIAALVAAHYEVAGDAEHAIQAYQRAARFAKDTYAYLETAESLRRALTLLQTLPDGDARQEQELEIQLDLGLALMIAKGFSDPEVHQAYSRALELCHATAAGDHLYETIWGLHQNYFWRGEYEKARIASEHCWQLAQRSGDPELLLQAHHAFWAVYFYSYVGPHGLQSVVEHTQQGIELYRPEWHRSHVRLYGNHDPGVCACFIQAKALWLLGYPDRAAQSVENGIALATRLGHPFSQVLALGQGSKVFAFRGELERVLDLWAQVEQIIAEHNLPIEGGEISIWRGWTLGQISPSVDAIALMEQGMVDFRDREAKINQALQAAILAESYIKIGDIASARQTIETGLTTTAATGEDYFRPELYRHQGHCFLAAGDLEGAYGSFQQALAVAQQQKAKSLELRAAMSVSLLWAEQGKRAQAYELLAGVYNWFTEGFDTADLRQAKEMLKALS